MKSGWRMFQSDTGINSLENQDLDERSFYCIKIFLGNFFKSRYKERNRRANSLLYQMILNLKGANGTERKKEQEYVHEFCIDKNNLLLTWNPCEGIIMLAEDLNGNRILREVEEVLENNKLWWCKGAS